MKKAVLFLPIIAILFVQGCVDTTSRATGVYMLLDTSGTYAKELENAQTIIKYLVGTLNPGDSLAIARIDSGSFSEKDIIAKVTFDNRPSVANSQKRAFVQIIEDFTKNVKGSTYTDINGGLLQAEDFLTEKGSGRKIVLIYSDLMEELPKGHVRDFELKLAGFEVIALNVTKLRSDIKDPKQYMKRIDHWRDRVEAGGGTWKVINDLDRLEAIFEQ